MEIFISGFERKSRLYFLYTFPFKVIVAVWLELSLMKYQAFREIKRLMLLIVTKLTLRNLRPRMKNTGPGSVLESLAETEEASESPHYPLLGSLLQSFSSVLPQPTREAQQESIRFPVICFICVCANEVLVIMCTVSTAHSEGGLKTSQQTVLVWFDYHQINLLLVNPRIKNKVFPVP